MTDEQWWCSTRAEVADAIAAAFLDGGWVPASMATRAGDVIQVAPPRLMRIARAVVVAHPHPPYDSRRELGRFIDTLDVLGRLWDSSDPPRIHRHAVPVSRMGMARWPVPRLDDLAAVAGWAGVPLPQLDWLADCKSLERRAAPVLRHYDRSWVYSRRGAVRLLEAPRPRLKALQRRVLHEILDLVPTHDAAHGFVAGRSVRSFAAPHAGRTVVLRVDLEAFFATINAGRVFGVLRASGYPEPVAYCLAGLLTTVLPITDARRAPHALRDDDLAARRRMLSRLGHPHLPQGAPSSPQIANLVAHRLDSRLSGLAASADAVYTRYADDLAFSLEGPDAARRGRRLIDAVRGIVGEEGFRVNNSKTRLMTEAQQQRLCGVVVNDRPGVARSERDGLRALLHNCVVSGPAAQNRTGEPDFRAYLLGRIAWVDAVNRAQGERLHAQFDRIAW